MTNPTQTTEPRKTTFAERLENAGGLIGGAVLRAFYVGISAGLAVAAYNAHTVPEGTQSSVMFPGIEWLLVGPAVLVLISVADFAIVGFHKAMRAWTTLAVFAYLVAYVANYYVGNEDPYMVIQFVAVAIIPVAFGALLAWPIRIFGQRRLDSAVAERTEH